MIGFLFSIFLQVFFVSCFVSFFYFLFVKHVNFHFVISECFFNIVNNYFAQCGIFLDLMNNHFKLLKYCFNLVDNHHVGIIILN